MAHKYSNPDPLMGSYAADGGLFNLGWYLSWQPRESLATLDGRFTSEELEAIARHMRSTPCSKPSS